jgi:hypothetical protein
MTNSKVNTGQFPGVAVGSNRLNSSGIVGRNNTPTATFSFSGIVGPNQTIPLSITGYQFYFPVANMNFFARPSKGVWCQYAVGTGDNIPDGFDLIEIQNPNTTPLVFQIVVASKDWIDKRAIPSLLTLDAPSNNVINTFFPGTDANTYDFADLSGTTFIDSNGVSRIAVKRKSLVITNASVNGSGTTWSPLTISLFFSTMNTADEFGTLICSSGGGLTPNFYAQAHTVTPFATNFVGPYQIYVPSVGADQTFALVSLMEIYETVISGYNGVAPS